MAFPTQSLLLASVSSQSAAASDSASLEISGDMTFEAWMKFTTLPESAASVYVANRDPDDNTNRVWAIAITNNAGTYQARFYNSSGGTNATTSGNVAINTGISATGTWYHCAWVYTAASSKIEFFLDGVSQGSNTGTVNSSMYTSGTAPLTIGSYDTGVSNFVNGNYSLVRLWKEVRSAAQLSANWCTVLGSTTNLQGEWTLDNVYTDNSGNSNTLTPANTPTFPSDVTSTCAVASSVKTWNGLAIASRKTHNGLASASVKTVNGLV